jgi:F-type H+-transporting ATPase subunit delta
MNPVLEGYAAAVLEEAAEEPGMARLAEELAAVDELVASSDQLGAALTDTAVPPAARRAVLSDLLQDRVSAPARRLASFTAGAVAAPEVPAALGWLVHHARVAAERGLQLAAPQGYLEGRRRVGGYAQAVFEQLEAATLEEVEDELFRFARTAETTPVLRSLLTDRDQAVAVRKGVVDDLLAGKVQPATLRLVDFVVTGGRARDALGTLFWLVDQTAAARGWRVARVRAAADLDQIEREHLGASLRRLTGGPVELQVTLEPELLAGVVVRIGDLQVDASCRGRLDELAEHMAAGTWHEPVLVRTDTDQGNEAEGAG